MTKSNKRGRARCFLSNGVRIGVRRVDPNFVSLPTEQVGSSEIRVEVAGVLCLVLILLIIDVEILAMSFRPFVYEIHRYALIERHVHVAV